MLIRAPIESGVTASYPSFTHRVRWWNSRRHSNKQQGRSCQTGLWITQSMPRHRHFTIWFRIVLVINAAKITFIENTMRRGRKVAAKTAYPIFIMLHFYWLLCFIMMLGTIPKSFKKINHKRPNRVWPHRAKWKRYWTEPQLVLIVYKEDATNSMQAMRM